MSEPKETLPSGFDESEKYRIAIQALEGIATGHKMSRSMTVADATKWAQAALDEIEADRLNAPPQNVAPEAVSETEKLVLENYCNEADDMIRSMRECLRQVKAWRDSEGNEGFPHQTRLWINELLDETKVFKLTAESCSEEEPETLMKTNEYYLEEQVRNLNKACIEYKDRIKELEAEVEASKENEESAVFVNRQLNERVVALSKQVERQSELLRRAYQCLREGKAKFMPLTTNSFVDLWLADYERTTSAKEQK